MNSNDDIPSVKQQYASPAYADFVEDESNSDFYQRFIHPTLVEVVSPYLSEAASLLDVGCGNGVLGRALREECPNLNVTGIDLSKAMLDRARSHHPECTDGAIRKIASTKFIQADFISDNLPELEETSFDIVVSGFVLCHISCREDLGAFFCRIHNLLKPGGVTAHIIPPTVSESEKGIEGAVHKAQITDALVVYDVHWDKSTYIREMTDAGFVRVSIVPCRFHGVTGKLSAHEENLTKEGYYVMLGHRK